MTTALFGTDSINTISQIFDELSHVKSALESVMDRLTDEEYQGRDYAAKRVMEDGRVMAIVLKRFAELIDVGWEIHRATKIDDSPTSFDSSARIFLKSPQQRSAALSSSHAGKEARG
ncbi:protein of unknown function [Nitrospira defluvii]|jgi:hypothetical protein|uniref:Uncharacterized protein n=1 Tax=Nitrospira defluvii TaxID=330214 RepID=D8P828_9BACT|nr:protein of unknown function [Nitrospira defluvii]